MGPSCSVRLPAQTGSCCSSNASPSSNAIHLLIDNLMAGSIRWHDAKGGELYCAAASPDGRLLAAGGEGRLLLFDRASGKLRAAFDETHREAVAQVGSTSHQNSGILSPSHVGRSLLIFDQPSGKLKAALDKTHQEAVLRIGGSVVTSKHSDISWPLVMRSGPVPVQLSYRPV